MFSATSGTILALLCAFALGAAPSLTINIHYPDQNICRNCTLLVGTSLNNFQVYEDDNSVLPSARTTKIAPSLYSLQLPINSSQIGSIVSVTTIYAIDVRLPIDPLSIPQAVQELIQLELHCFNILLGTTVRALGQQPTITLGPEETVLDTFPYFCTRDGKLETIPKVYSPQLNDTRRVLVMVPPSLLENPIPRYLNIILMPDGQFAPWITSSIFDLINDGLVAETIVIGLPSSVDRNYELTPTVCNPNCQPCPLTSGGGPRFVDFCVDTVLPMVLKRFGVMARPSNVTMGGYSYGGLLSCWAPYLRPDAVRNSYCGSPSLSWNCNQFSNELVGSALPANEVYLDYGTGEAAFMSEPAEEAYSALQKQGMVAGSNLWLYASPGDYHETNSWKRRFWRAATSLLQHPAMQ